MDLVVMLSQGSAVCDVIWLHIQCFLLGEMLDLLGGLFGFVCVSLVLKCHVTDTQTL